MSEKAKEREDDKKKAKTKQWLKRLASALVACIPALIFIVTRRRWRGPR